MPKMEHCNILRSSISFAVTSTTAQLIASRSITGLRAYRCLSVNCLESLSHSNSGISFTRSGSRMTAAQNTLPASGPRPASSQPASIIFATINGLSINAMYDVQFTMYDLSTKELSYNLSLSDVSILFFVVKIDFVVILLSSILSSYKSCTLHLGNISLSIIRLNQWLVSSISSSTIFNLFKKSLSDFAKQAAR